MLLTSKSRSRREYLIQSNNIIVLDHFFNSTKKSNLIGRLLRFITIFDNLVVAYFLSHPVYPMFSLFRKDVEDWFGCGKLNVFSSRK